MGIDDRFLADAFGPTASRKNWLRRLYHRRFTGLLATAPVSGRHWIDIGSQSAPDLPSGVLDVDMDSHKLLIYWNIDQFDIHVWSTTPKRRSVLP